MAQSKTKHCTNCGAEIKVAAEFCSYCGASQAGGASSAMPTVAGGVTRCPHCGRDNPSTAKYCDSCGAPLEELTKLQNELQAREESLKQLQQIVEDTRQELEREKRRGILEDKARGELETELAGTRAKMSDLERRLHEKEQQVLALNRLITEANEALRTASLAATGQQEHPTAPTPAPPSPTPSPHPPMMPHHGPPLLPPPRAAASSWFCANCGNQIRPTSKFCPYCGVPQS